MLAGLFELDDSGAPALCGRRCLRCGEAMFPPRSACPRCKPGELVPLKLGDGAKLFSFTVCHAGPAGWKVPYLQAYVELPEKLRVFTLISDSVKPDGKALEVGMAMELVIEPLSHAPEVSTYKFRPVAATAPASGKETADA